MPDASGVARLAVPESPAKSDMLELLDHIRAGVECGEIIGVMVTAVGTEMKFANYSCGALPATSRIGFLMCHVDDLIRSMKE